MKRVLIITYYWPPSGGAGVQRWLKFAKYLPEFGWDPIIYTPENPEAPADDQSLLKDVSPKVTILRRPIVEPYQFYKRFLGISSKERINAGFLTENKRPGKKERISVWIRGNLFIPDARKFWIRPSAKYLKRFLKTTPVDAIVSTGPPHSMHLIAKKVNKATGIPWLADFRDPWTGIDFYSQLMLSRFADRKHRKMEKSVLTSASRVVVVGNSMVDEFKGLAGIDSAVVTNGFDLEDFQLSEVKRPQEFTILHIGAMNRDRNHDAFWEAIQRILSKNQPEKSLRVKLIGKLDVSVVESLKKFDLERVCEIIPYLAHEKIPMELSTASLLYLPINNTPNARSILTGKIFEYLAAGRQILGVGPVDGDAASILKDAKAGSMIDFTDGKAMEEFILKAWDDFESRKDLELNPPMAYSRKQLTQKMAELLEKLGQ